jgi:hypothetical protein
MPADVGGWFAADADGSVHSCPGDKRLPNDIILSIQGAVTETDKWMADKFVKRLASYRYLYPKAKIDHVPFVIGSLYDRQYLIRCSDKAFKEIMRHGKV